MWTTTFLYDNKQTLIATKIDAINLASNYINDGKILAIKSMGGFHIVCDASNDETIFRLRELKKRATKPFAVMFKDVDSLRNYAIYSNLEQDILTSQKTNSIIAEKEKSKSIKFSCTKYKKNWLFFTK